jgi:hypothetical protein
VRAAAVGIAVLVATAVGGGKAPRIGVVTFGAAGSRILVHDGRWRRVATFATAPVVAPNGHRVAYVANRTLFVARLDGTHAKRIVTSCRRDHCAAPSAAWSSDGSRVAYAAGTTRGPRIGIATATGRVVRDLTPRRRDVYRVLGWSSDRRWIAVETRDEYFPTGLWLLRASGGERRRLMRYADPHHDFVHVTWSPRGALLAISAAATGFPGFAIYDAAARRFGVRRTSCGKPSICLATSAIWSPDGTSVLFGTAAGIVRLAAQGGRPRLVSRLPDLALQAWRGDRVLATHYGDAGVFDPRTGTFTVLRPTFPDTPESMFWISP